MRGLAGVECNIDDVLVHGKDQEEHSERLKAVLMRLLEAGVILNLDKCEFSTQRVKCLGHVIRFSGIEADPEKLRAITDLPPPQNVQEVRTFLGMVNQLVTFSEQLADKISETFTTGTSGKRESSRRKHLNESRLTSHKSQYWPYTTQTRRPR